MAKDSDILSAIAEANDRLKSAGVGLAIQRSGNRLRLRGRLPDSSGEIDRRYISTGILVSRWGVREIERLAHHIRDLISKGKFDIAEWRQTAPPSDRRVGDWIDRFEADYFNRRKRSPSSETTYRTEYQQAFRKLDPDALLTSDLLVKAIVATEPDSRTRSRVCLCFQRLADFAGIDADLRSLRGNYSSKSVDPRSLPTHDEIIVAVEAIASPAWRQVAQILYLWGLRNHEALKISAIDGLVVEVADGKTGGRKVFPCDRSLVERWHIEEIDRPPVTGRTHADLGHRVSTQFRRYGLPFRPYDLRHCYARRLHEAGATSHFASRMMGHSIKVHEAVYAAWWGFDSYQQQYDRLDT
jgi:integrase